MKPLGWWLRHVHELLESSMTQTLEAESLTRRHWQVLNAIILGAHTVEEIDTTMAPFVAEDGSMAPKVADLRTRSWVTDGDRFSLTDEGVEAHARIEEHIKAFRSAATAGISDEDHLATMRTLEKYAANLEALTTA